MLASWLSLALALDAAAAPGAPSSLVVELVPLQQGRPTVLVLRRSTPNMDTFVEGLTSELKAEFNLIALEVGREATVELLDETLGRLRPDALVLLDNPTAELYRRYQEQHPDAPFPPAVLSMGLFVEKASARIRNATGIAYEVPAVTSFGRLRITVAGEVSRIGVVHRPLFSDLVDDQARLAGIEGFEIVPVEVSDRPRPGQVRRALRALDALDVDALWVLNDNVLLTPELLVEAWLPLMRRNERPVVVGVVDLLRTNPPVGSFAVVPDHQSLGMQAAQLIYELRDAGWAVGRAPPQLPIAVETVLHRPFLEEHVGLQPGAIDEIDEIIE